MNDYTIDSLLKKALELGASDLHFIVGEVPAFRIDGKIIKSKLEPVTEDDVITEECIRECVEKSHQELK